MTAKRSTFKRMFSSDVILPIIYAAVIGFLINKSDDVPGLTTLIVFIGLNAIQYVVEQALKFHDLNKGNTNVPGI